MDKKDSSLIDEPGWLKNFEADIRENLPKFAPEQLVECSGCHRKNPPTRMACLYCGAKLEIPEKNELLLRPVWRKLEEWEKGFNVIRLPKSETVFNNSSSDEIAAFLQLEAKNLNEIFCSEIVLPLARVENSEEAEIISKRLAGNGVSTTIIPDESLKLNEMPRRVRRVEFGDGSPLRFSGNNENFVIDWNDINVFVIGGLFENRREASEKRKRRENVEIESSEFSSDQKVLDFYSKNEPRSFRIQSNSFDFSCLREKKRLLASENFQILIEEFKKRAVAQAFFDDNYKTARAVIDLIWETEERRESTGWTRHGIGKINLESLVTVNNHNQFLRYSRMLRVLAENRT